MRGSGARDEECVARTPPNPKARWRAVTDAGLPIAADGWTESERGLGAGVGAQVFLAHVRAVDMRVDLRRGNI